MSIRRLFPIIPALVFFILAGLFAYRLQMMERGQTPDNIPSVMINHAAPTFVLPPLFEQQTPLSNALLRNHITLINVFSSWCVPCRAEHPSLFEIKKAGVQLLGINYKDTPENARLWLQRLGNPFDNIGSDRDGHVSIDFGVYGVPESYLIDKDGIIRFKQTGPLTPETIETVLLPLARKLNR